MVSTRHQTKLARNAASATQVFQTAELLEMILLYVCEDSARTAFLSRRVNTFFKDTIEGSVHLQRALFLRRDDSSPASESGTGVRINPIFDVTGIRQPPRNLEVYDFRRTDEWLQNPMNRDYSYKGLVQSVDIWLEDAVVVDRREGVLRAAVLVEKGDAEGKVHVGVYVRLREGLGVLPEAVRVPVWFGGWRRITVGEVVEKARGKLAEWYPWVYGGPGRVAPWLNRELGLEI